MPKNIFYAQSGGVTAVINATACGLIETIRKKRQENPEQIGNLFAGKNGILGALNEELIDVKQESDEAIAALRHTPGGAFGSCRYKLKSLDESREEYQRLIEVFKTHNIGYFFYNGGGDSQDTTHKISQMSQAMNYPLSCIGLPKTIDNDLPITDNCPGFGSVAKYVATSIREASLDVISMAKTSTKVFIMEVMGRHAGWIAASAGLAQEEVGDAPHIILLPEITFDQSKFLQRVQDCVDCYGYCCIVVSEGVKNDAGQFLADSGIKDAFGHAQLGGVAPVIAALVKQELGLKYHWAVCDYLQRSARHLASKTDVDQAYALGQAAVEKALEGINDVMLTIERQQANPYQWNIGTTELASVANVEKKMPRDFISQDGFHITQSCRDYLSPLIQGEDFPKFNNGLPSFARLKLACVEKKLG